MRPWVAWTIAAKELRESLRDRRTLFLMVFLPILLYPALLLLVSQVAMVQAEQLEEQTSRVGYFGATVENPAVAALGTHPWIELRALSPTESLPSEVDVDAYVDLSNWRTPPDPALSQDAVVHFESVVEESRLAVDRIEEVLEAWADDELQRRLAEHDLAPAFANPSDHELVNHSDTSTQGGYVLGSLLPIIVIITVLMGAYYPAIDLTAGEKERGSIQTLFTAPISSLEIVGGKYVAVVGIATISGSANLISMARVVGQNLILSEELAEELDLTISVPVFGALLLNMFLMALLFSAVLLAVAVLARSFKEAQTYITPVYLICLVPAMIAQLPGFEYSPGLGLVPGVGAILLMKSLLLDGVAAEPMFLVGASTVVYTLAVLVVAARLFGQEQVIIGERGSFRIITPPSEIVPRPQPGPGEVLAWYCVAFVLLFYVGSNLQLWHPQLGLALTLWVVLLAPTVGLAVYLKLELRETFHLGRPSAVALVGALLLGVGAMFLVNAANGVIDRFILETPPELAEEMARFFPEPERAVDWVLLLLLVAVSPAICEEALFRGFILSGLRDRVPDWQVIVATGVMFGLFHLSVYRMFGTAVLGMAMAWIVLRTRSIWPAVVFHAVNNGLAVVLAYTVGEGLADDMPASFGVLLLAAGTATLGGWLVSRDARR